MPVGDLAWWLGLLFGAAPLLCLAAYHAADAWYRAAFFLAHGKKRLPPGHMGIPFLGETLSLLWYFKHARRPDAFISAKKLAYSSSGHGGDGGDGIGMYRTHLFGSPSVIACSPAANKFVFQSPDSFGIRWPVPELVGVSSVVNVEGGAHARLRGFIIAAINRPSSLRTIAAVVQPRVVAALEAWAAKGSIVAAAEVKKVRSFFLPFFSQLTFLWLASAVQLLHFLQSVTHFFMASVANLVFCLSLSSKRDFLHVLD